MTTEAERIDAIVALVRRRGGNIWPEGLWAYVRYHRVHNLADLDEPAFYRLLRRAASLGRLMRQETDDGPRYWTAHPSRAIGSELDAETAAFRDHQRRQHPGDLPGQMTLFAEGRTDA